MFSKELFGRRLTEIRVKHGETQTDLGQLLGIGKTQVSQIENGVSNTSVERLASICEHYKVSADYLLGLSDSETHP